VVIECWGKATPLQKLFRLQGGDLRIGKVDITLQALRNLARTGAGAAAGAAAAGEGGGGSQIYTLGIDKLVEFYPFTIQTLDDEHNSGRSFLGCQDIIRLVLSYIAYTFLQPTFLHKFRNTGTHRCSKVSAIVNLYNKFKTRLTFENCILHVHFISHITYTFHITYCIYIS
jgi:hypothetical protein